VWWCDNEVQDMWWKCGCCVLCVMMMYVRWSDELVVMCNMVMMSVRCVVGRM